MKLFKRTIKSDPPLTQSQQADAERERRVADREPIDYSYTVFWTKQARLWDAAARSDVAACLSNLLKSPEFQANPFDRKYTLDGVEGAHSGASLIALEKVLAALKNE
ncbi:MAG: hypothetical protein HY870_07910 [Chloroflexi bacterium]|nr:hypothetical protein [Chloroflexota bacterium]